MSRAFWVMPAGLASTRCDWPKRRRKGWSMRSRGTGLEYSAGRPAREDLDDNVAAVAAVPGPQFLWPTLACVSCRDTFHQPLPGLLFRGARRLADGNLEIGNLLFDLLARQHLEAAHQDRRLDHGGLRAIKSLKCRVRRNVQYAAVKTRALFVFGDAIDHKLGMGEGAGKALYRYPVVRDRRPVVAPREAAGENAHVIGIIGHRVRNTAQIVQRRRRTKRRDDPFLTVRDKSERRQVDGARRTGGRENCFTAHRHWFSALMPRIVAWGRFRTAWLDHRLPGRRRTPRAEAHLARSACPAATRSPPSSIRCRDRRRGRHPP